jgi:hypothetical protein
MHVRIAIVLSGWLTLSIWLALSSAAATAETISPRARMSEGEAAEEFWDLDARFESGHHVMARFFVTNTGPGIHTAAATGHVVFPDGTNKPFRNGRQQGAWKLRGDGLFLDIGSSDFDMSGPVRSLDVDNEKRGIKLHLKIEADPAREREAPLVAGYHVDLIDLAAPVSGTLWTSEIGTTATVRGHATLTHSWMERPVSSLIQQRIDVVGRDENTAFWFQRLTTPSGEVRSRLLTEQAGDGSFEVSGLETALRGRIPHWDRAEYPVPARIEFSNAAVSGTVDLQRIVLDHDPTQDLPQLFRLLLSFRSRPWRAWTDSSISVKSKGRSEHGPPQIHAAATTSVTFLNPLPTP